MSLSYTAQFFSDVAHPSHESPILYLCLTFFSPLSFSWLRNSLFLVSQAVGETAVLFCYAECWPDLPILCPPQRCGEGQFCWGGHFSQFLDYICMMWYTAVHYPHERLLGKHITSYHFSWAAEKNPSQFVFPGHLLKVHRSDKKSLFWQVRGTVGAECLETTSMKTLSGPVRLSLHSSAKVQVWGPLFQRILPLSLCAQGTTLKSASLWFWLLSL